MPRVSALKFYRGNRKQADVAQAAGIGLPRYNQIETGRRRLVKPDVARRIAAAVGQPLDAIFAPSAFSIRDIEVAEVPPHSLD